MAKYISLVVVGAFLLAASACSGSEHNQEGFEGTVVLSATVVPSPTPTSVVDLNELPPYWETENDNGLCHLANLGEGAIVVFETASICLFRVVGGDKLTTIAMISAASVQQYQGLKSQVETELQGLRYRIDPCDGRFDWAPSNNLMGQLDPKVDLVTSWCVGK